MAYSLLFLCAYNIKETKLGYCKKGNFFGSIVGCVIQ